MQLASLPSAHASLVVVGTSVRKPLPILQAYLASLAWQERPQGVEFRYAFVPDWPTPDDPVEHYLREWCARNGGEVLRAGPPAAGDFSDAPGTPTHQWSLPAMARVGAARNRLLQRAIDLKADAIWLVDADLVCDRTTFASLWALERPIACAVYWTHWAREASETRPKQAGPQVWLRHPYHLDGRGFDMHEFRARLAQRALTRVWGQGACSLIRTPVVSQGGVSFARLNEPNLLQGLMAGEDRHFCIRAERAHIEMWAEPWPDIFHCYHAPEDVARLASMTERLGAPHPQRAAFGDLVSLRLDALEPFPQGTPGGIQWARVPPQFVRGRLGALNLLPELDDAILDLTRGANATIPLHVPLHYPQPYMRGRRRLVRVELLDCKPNGFAPVLEDELRVGRSGRPLDRTLLTTRQQEATV